MKNHELFKSELEVQSSTLEELCGENKELMLSIIVSLGETFRAVISEFERVQGRCPNKEELIWCASVEACRNIREI